MQFKGRYERAKERLIGNSAVCPENRRLFEDFFADEEYKLKRINGLENLDDPAYKTLLTYICRLRLLNRWFANKPWPALERSDIQRVFDGLEDGGIKSKKGQRYRDRDCFYQIMRGKPFELAGKDKLAKEVLRYCHGRDRIEVRYVTEETVRKLVEAAIRLDQKLLIWLAFDVGENVGTLVRLQKRDFARRENPDTREIEYIVNLPKNKLKRSRTTRSEITNFNETAQLLDMWLSHKRDEDALFSFQPRQANRFLSRAVAVTSATCLPAGQRVTWKDLRSSMACHLLTKSWSLDEIKARLGHSPSSRVLDKYVSYLAIDRQAPKKKFHASEVRTLQVKLEDREEQMKLLSIRQERMNSELTDLRHFRREVEEKLASFSMRTKKLKSG